MKAVPRAARRARETAPWLEPTSLVELLADGDDDVLFSEAAEQPDPSVQRRDERRGPEEGAAGAAASGKRKEASSRGADTSKKHKANKYADKRDADRRGRTPSKRSST